MRTVLSAKLRQQQLMVISLPRESVFLDVRVVSGIPVLWVEVDTSLPKEDRLLLLAETGQEIPDVWNLGYVGSFVVSEQGRAFHLFEAMRKGSTMPKTGLGRQTKYKRVEWSEEEGSTDGKKDEGTAGRADKSDVQG